jgi:hypothetical protein
VSARKKLPVPPLALSWEVDIIERAVVVAGAGAGAGDGVDVLMVAVSGCVGASRFTVFALEGEVTPEQFPAFIGSYDTRAAAKDAAAAFVERWQKKKARSKRCKCKPIGAS